MNKLSKKEILVGKSPMQLSMMRLRRNPQAMIAFVIIMIFILLSVIGNFNIFGLQDAANNFNLDNRYIKPFTTIKTSPWYG